MTIEWILNIFCLFLFFLWFLSCEFELVWTFHQHYYHQWWFTEFSLFLFVSLSVQINLQGIANEVIKQRRWFVTRNHQKLNQIVSIGIKLLAFNGFASDSGSSWLVLYSLLLLLIACSKLLWLIVGHKFPHQKFNSSWQASLPACFSPLLHSPMHHWKNWDLLTVRFCYMSHELYSRRDRRWVKSWFNFVVSSIIVVVVYKRIYFTYFLCLLVV